MLKGDINNFKFVFRILHIFPIIIFLLISPFNIVFASSSTYYSLSSGCQVLEQSNGEFTRINVSNSNVRLFQAYTSSSRRKYLLVSNIPFNYYYADSFSNDNVSCDIASTLATSFVVNNITYYISTLGSSVGYSRLLLDVPVMTSNSSLTQFNTFENNSGISGETDDDLRKQAVYYTFGAGAVGPEPSVSYGQLKIGFKTDIAYSGGNQNAWRLNKDTIYFDRYDTLGNDLFGNLIELQAVPYSVYDQSKQNLLNKTVNDYVFDTVRVGSLGYWSPGQDYIDFTWEYITNRFSPTWWSTLDDNYSLVGWYLNEKWYRVGWAYRARLVDEDNNELIPWQWIYNGTSIDTQDVVNIVDNNGLTPELVNSINNINNYNNTTNNNTYNNQVVNYYSSDQESDGSWLEALLEMIASTIGNLIDLIKGIFHDLLLGLFNLVQTLGVNLIQFFSDLFDSITDSFGNIDLELPYFDVPTVSENDWFKDLFTQFVNDTVSSGIGFIIFIPLVVILIGVLF